MTATSEPGLNGTLVAGVDVGGYVDAEDGSVSMAVNLGMTHLPLGPMREGVGER